MSILDWRRTSLLGALLLGGPLGLAAETPAPTVNPPAPQPMRALHFPAFEERSLANGLRVVLVEQHEIPAVSIHLLLPAGKLYVAPQKAGLAEATAGLLTKGTSGRTAPQIADAIDRVGGVLASSAGTDFAFLTARVTSDQFDLALDLLTDALLHPTFPAAELDRWRRQALSELQLRRADGNYLADIAFQRLVYGTFPYGAPRIGTAESLPALQQQDLIDFHHRQYIPNGAILAVVGDIASAAAFAKVEHAFAGWQRGQPLAVPPFTAVASTQRTILVLDKPDAVQTQIRIGGLGLAYSDPDLVVERVYNQVLGGDSDSRLFAEIRQKRGLTYGADSGFSEDSLPGLFRAATYTKTTSTVETLAAMLDVITELGRTGVTSSELDAKKTNMIGGFPLEIETPDGVASLVISALARGRDRAFVERYRELVGAVTADQVARFARMRVHPDQATIVLVGNLAAFGEALRARFGAFETLPASTFDPLAPRLLPTPEAAPHH